MNKFVSIIIILLFPVFFINSSTINNNTKKILDLLEGQYPTLKDQVSNINNNFYENIDINKAVQNLYDYASIEKNKDQNEIAEIKKSVDMILLPDEYKEYHDINDSLINIDGKNTEWSRGLNKITDDRGDSYKGKKEYDLIEANVFINDNSELYLMIKTGGKPDKEQIFDFFLDLTGNSKYELFFQVWKSKNGNYYSKFIELYGEKRKFKISAKYAVDQIFEVFIPLKEIGLDNKKIKDNIKIYPRVSDIDAVKTDNGKEIVLFNKNKNYALFLLLSLLERGKYIKGDCITSALALSNNYLFFLSDADVKKEILKDMDRHFDFYKKIINWQEKNKLSYSLKPGGIIPKIFWSYRMGTFNNLIYDEINIDKNEKLTLPVYLEFVDRVETFEEIFNIINESNLYNKSLIKTASNIEGFIHKNLIYRTNIENYKLWCKQGFISEEDLKKFLQEEKDGKFKRFYFKRERFIDDFRWLNYQLQNYKNDNEFIGDCGDATVSQMGFYKACGISTLSLQWIHPKGISSYNHNFPAFFNPSYNKWFTVQKPDYIYDDPLRFKEHKYKFLYYTKPVWHYWKSYYQTFIKEDDIKKEYHNPFYQGEYALTERIVSFLILGIDGKHLDDLFCSDQTQKPGLFFNETTAPADLKDTDMDGLPDLLEKSINTDYNNYDTDGDCFSDLWEFEEGYDPLRKESPGGEKTIVLDGFLDDFKKHNNIKIISDPEGDTLVKKNIFDISNLYIKEMNNDLFVGIEYYNNIFNNISRQHELWITSYNFSGSHIYWIGGGWYKDKIITAGNKNNNKCNLMIYKNNKWEKIETNDRIKINVLNAGEFFIPLELLGNPDKIQIRYSVMSGDKNNEKRASDETENAVYILSPDSDHDGLSDKEEIKRGTEPENWDSDGDKFSDYWEIKNNYNPLFSGDLSNNKIIAIDGFFDEWINREDVKSIDDDMNDSKVKENVFDIKKLSVLVNNKLIIGAEYYNDIQNEKITQHEFWINTSSFYYWMAVYDDGKSKMMIYKNKKWQNIEIKNDIISNMGRKLEMVIPLKYFDNQKIIDIRYTVMSGSKNKEVRVSDETGILILD